MEGTVTVIVGGAKCGKTQLARFLADCDGRDVEIIDWQPTGHCNIDSEHFDYWRVLALEGKHVIVTATLRKGGTAPREHQMYGAVDNVIWLEQFNTRNARER